MDRGRDRRWENGKGGSDFDLFIEISVGEIEYGFELNRQGDKGEESCLKIKWQNVVLIEFGDYFSKVGEREKRFKDEFKLF